jgi:hypothetical protein
MRRKFMVSYPYRVEWPTYDPVAKGKPGGIWIGGSDNLGPRLLACGTCARSTAAVTTVAWCMGLQMFSLSRASTAGMLSALASDDRPLDTILGEHNDEIGRQGELSLQEQRLEMAWMARTHPTAQ